MWHLSQEAKGYTSGHVRQAGFNWLKHQVEWSAIETVARSVQLGGARHDRQRGYSGDQVNIMITVADAPTFYRGPTQRSVSERPDTFQNLMQAMATSLRGAGRRPTSCGTSRTWRAKRAQAT